MSEVQKCSGRDCEEPSIGKLHDLKEVPTWRCVNDRPANQRQFELVATVYYCAGHEQIAKALNL